MEDKGDFKDTTVPTVVPVTEAYQLEDFSRDNVKIGWRTWCAVFAGAFDVFNV